MSAYKLIQNERIFTAALKNVYESSSKLYKQHIGKTTDDMKKPVKDPQDDVDASCKLLCDEASNHMKVRNYNRALNVYNKPQSTFSERKKIQSGGNEMSDHFVNKLLGPFSSEASMLQLEDYRQIVLEIILEGQHVSRKVSELRLSLFIRAAHHYLLDKRIYESLYPVPSCFFDQQTKLISYEALYIHVQSIPKLTDFTQNTSLPELTWSLLYWIFTNPLTIAVIEESEISHFTIDDLRESTSLARIPYPSHNCTLFKIRPSVPKKSFLESKKQFGTFFAYHGSPSENFHSIIHRGLISALNRRSAYGYGTYLTSNLGIARTYSESHMNHLSNDNLRSLAGNLCCVAIVEVINDPSIKNVPFISMHSMSDEPVKYYIVDRDELMQLRYLIVFN